MSFPAFAVLAGLSGPATAAPTAAAPLPRLGPVLPGVGRDGDGTLEVITFNTWGLPFPVAKPRGGRFPAIQRFLRESAPDVAALQEVWRGARSLLSMEGLRYPHGEHDSGLAVLSRHHTAETRGITFSQAVGFDRFKDKGALLATVEHAVVGELTVVSTHLQAGSGDKAARVRGTQVDELIALVSSVHGPVVVMGDFNLYDRLDADRASHERLLAAGLVDAAEVTAVLDPTHHGAAARLDRVYVRDLSPVAAEVLPAAGMSDHRPVRVVLDVL